MRAPVSWTLSTALVAAALSCARTDPAAPPRPRSPSPELPAPDPLSFPTAVATTGPADSAVPSVAAPAVAAPAPAADSPDPGPPLPPGFVSIPDRSEVRCGNLRIQMVPEGRDFPRFVRVLGADGKRLYEAHGRRFKIDATDTLQADLAADFCGDLTGDGVPDLVMTESTLGAHCCYTRYVVSLTSPPRRILMWEKGDAGTEIRPVKLRPGPTWQLTDLVVMWPPFDGNKGDPVLSYASAPLVPVVFSFNGGEFKLTSLSFPEVYRKNRDELRAGCAATPNECFGEIIEWIDSLAIGDWDTEKLKLKDPDLRKGLDRNAAAMRKIMAAQLGSEGRPGKTEPNP